MAEDVVQDRPVCRCHGEPQIKDGHHPTGTQKWQCAVKERARQAELYTDPEYRAKRRQQMRDYWDRMPHEQRSAKNLRAYFFHYDERIARREAEVAA